MDHSRSTPGSVRPSFDEFAEFIREWARIPKRKQIAPGTLFERDLGITGDDGCELLEEAERRFGVCLSSPEHGYAQTFSLDANETLFHGEGFLDLFTCFGLAPTVRKFTVGELFNAVRSAPAKHGGRGSAHTSILGLDE